MTAHVISYIYYYTQPYLERVKNCSIELELDRVNAFTFFFKNQLASYDGSNTFH